MSNPNNPQLDEIRRISHDENKRTLVVDFEIAVGKNKKYTPFRVAANNIKSTKVEDSIIAVEKKYTPFRVAANDIKSTKVEDSTIAVEKECEIRRISHDENKRTLIENFEVAVGKKCEYPSAWFAKHNKKPTLYYDEHKDATLAQLYITMRHGFKTHQLNTNVVMYYIIRVMELHQQTLTSDWKSFNQMIGKAGEKVKLSNVITLVPRPATLDLQSSTNEAFPLKKHIANLVVLCGAYRVSCITGQYHKKQVTKDVRAVLLNVSNENLNIDSFLQSQAHWGNHLPFRALMAALDMYLQEFPTSEFSPVRVGTSVSRFKDCSALLSLHYSMKNLGLTFTTFAPWIWTTNCADQFSRLVKGGEEMDNIRSYAMYFMDLGLSEKSPYSASSNPDIHFLFHTIGSSSGQARSYNAPIVGYPQMDLIMNNAIIISYALCRYNEGPSPSDALGGLMGDREEEPASRDPTLWLEFIASKGGKIPDYIYKRVTRQWIRNSGLRERSIGEYLKMRVPVDETEE